LHVITPEQLNGPALNQLIGQAIAEGVAAWIVVANLPAPRWERWLLGGLRAEQWELVGDADTAGGPPPIMAIRDSAATALLTAAGVDLAALRAAASGIRALPGARITIEPRRRVVEEPTLPNVVGILEGSDRLLRDEAVVFVAHMDHVGVTADGRCAAIGADSVCNGANDNASGTVGVIELAEAYASLRPRPARSMVFVAVSGEERGLFGSRNYVNHPAIPIPQTVAVIGLDEIARNTPDTMIAVGKGFSSLGQVLDGVVGAHPELGLLALDDLWPEQNYFRRSDHYPFARLGVPALALYAGNSAEVHRPNDVVETADWEKASRIVRAAFYLGLEVANATGRPMWDAAARQRIVQGGN
jgi:Zn-dependent M28 family amino/carboxypeptidase